MKQPSPSPSAGVRIDPQLIYAIPLVIGLAAERWFPTRATPDRLAAPLGIGCIVLGVAVAFAAARRFRSASTTLQPWEPTTTLVTDGPFRFSRNPIYLAYTVLYLGVGFWVNSLWPLFLLPAVLWLMHRLVIHREEGYLEREFGEKYLAYRGKVRRWV